MEVLEEGMVMGESNSNNKMQTQIVKGKRTKRQRPQSPTPFRIPPAYSPKSDHASSHICSNIQHNSGGVDDDDDSHSNSAIDALRPTSSSDEYYTYGHRTSEEEEDMANCLILLAQGQSRRSPPPNQATVDAAGCKFTSRKFRETGTSTETGKVGCHVYECKTCSKTFPSFQALGGHRASHKKPKAKEDDEKRHHNLFPSDTDDSTPVSPSLSLQLNSRSWFNNNNNKNKSRVHECSICGAEFSSGQALGGHMRRHRGSVVAGSQAALSFTPTAAMDADHRHHHRDEKQGKNNVLSLDLDLNLPAPNDDHKESNFHFASKQPQEPPQQPPKQLVFSPPTLVDCHY